MIKKYLLRRLLVEYYEIIDTYKVPLDRFATTTKNSSVFESLVYRLDSQLATSERHYSLISNHLCFRAK